MIQEGARLQEKPGSAPVHRLSDAGASKSKALTWAFLVVILAPLLSTYALADSGAEIYKTRCAACHGARGAGDTMLGKNLQMRHLGSDEVQRKSDDELAGIISRGKNKMPHFDRKLSKDQIDEVVKYVRSLSNRGDR